MGSLLREEAMHVSIRENLEEYLKDPAGKIPREFHAHIEACEDCATELRLLEAQAGMLRSLQTEREIEPRAGFYGRVMERIEDQRRASIWAVFLEPAFGRRLAWTSAAAVLALGTYLVTTELAEPQIAEAPSAIAVSLPSPQVSARPTETSAAATEASVPADNARQQRKRNAVLVNLASFRQ
jgi:hypothetical protein